MDPASIIGIASATLTFIDFGMKFVSLAKGFYESSSGKSAEVNEMEQLCRHIRGSSAALQNSINHSPQTPGQQDLKEASTRCLAIARKVLGVLEKCVPAKTNSAMSSVAAAERMLLKKKDIDQIRDELDRAQPPLLLALMSVIR